MSARPSRFLLLGCLAAALSRSQELPLEPPPRAQLDIVPSSATTNGRIVFVSHRDGVEEIYVMDPDGSNQTRLTNNAVQEIFPVWSPDGTRIAFTSYRDGGGGEIYVMNADGSDVTRLTNNSFEDREPAWSPDGSQLAFVSEGAGPR